MDGIEASGCSSSDLSATTSINVRNQYNTTIKETTS